MVNYTAVIFDLFGTLVDSFSPQEYEHVLAQIASALSVPFKDFVRLWLDTFNERAIGVFPNPEANIEYICRMLGVSLKDDRIKAATQIRFNFVFHSLTPRDDAVETLVRLKSKGYKIGLISDCSAEVPVLWEDTPFASLIDMPVFSCSAGLKKPDPRIYQLACERLRVDPKDCLYVGDGSSHELTGASQVGMHPVLIRVPYEDDDNYDIHQREAEDWDGPVISALKDVLALVK